VLWLIDWIEKNMFAAPGRWNERRLITEWEDTRIWLERRLKEAFADTEHGDERIATFTGIDPPDGSNNIRLSELDDNMRFDDHTRRILTLRAPVDA
jgi:hypothetical protein